MTLTVEQKSEILQLQREGLSLDRIHSITKHSKPTIHKYIHSPYIANKENIAAGRGRKRKLDDEQVQVIKRVAEQNNLLGSRRITPIVNERLSVDLTDRPIRNYLQDNEYGWKKPHIKWVLTDQQKSNRVLWAKARVGKTDWD